MPPPDINISTAAIALVREHGDKVLIFAAVEADAMLEVGDMNRAAHWRLVLAAVSRMVEPEETRQ